MALPTSGTYNFLSTQASLLIDKAFQKLGKKPTELVPYDVDNAVSNMNLILLDWVNRGINLWLLRRSYLSLARYQATYILDPNISEIIQINTRTFTRILGATPASVTLNRVAVGVVQSNTTNSYDSGGGGNPLLAFDGNLATSCLQVVVDGNISKDYGVGQTRTVTSVGVIPIAATTLVVEYCLVNPANPVNWTQIATINAPTLNQLNSVNIAAPQAARYYRVRGTGGATLNIVEIYFNTGIAANAFDNDPNTSCTQQDPNGVISYNYAAPVGSNAASPNVIFFIGIRSKTTQTYTINVRASILNDGNYITLLSLPAQVYTAGVTVWCDLPQPVSALYYDIIEVTANNPTPLDISEIYLTNNTFDIPVNNVGRWGYLNFTNKSMEARPSNYYFNKQIDPTLTIWPLAAPGYQVLQISAQILVQDVGQITNTIQIPPLFYLALVDTLATTLAQEYRPDLVQILQTQSERSFSAAYANNTENVPLTLRPDWSSIL
jgi:hypothetical protein